MQKTRTSLLLHPLFISSLFVLLLNDFSWKHEYHNWLTGKLSDVAGLVVLPVFLLAFFPLRKKEIWIVATLFFTWWKSPLSEPVILFLNQKLAIPASRVIDYSDLFALPTLLLASRIKPVCYRALFPVQACLRFCIGAITLFALCATTVPYREGLRYGLRESEIKFYEYFKSAMTKEELLQHLQSKGINVYQEQVRYYPMLKPDELYYLVSSPKDSTIQWTPVPQSRDSAIYLRREAGPFYVVPFYVLNGDTLRNLEFSIQNNNNRKKKITIWIESFQTDKPEKYRDFFYGKQRKQYKKHFDALFSAK